MKFRTRPYQPKMSLILYLEEGIVDVSKMTCSFIPLKMEFFLLIILEMLSQGNKIGGSQLVLLNGSLLRATTNWLRLQDHRNFKKVENV